MFRILKIETLVNKILFVLQNFCSQRNKIPSFKTRHNLFKDSLFPAVIVKWNSLGLKYLDSPNVFKKELWKFIRPEPNSTYGINDTKRLNLLTRLWLGLNHLVDHKFRHSFQDCIPNVLLRSGY